MFLRIHRSFIVNKTRVTAFGSVSLKIGETELPISRSYKKHVLAELEG